MWNNHPLRTERNWSPQRLWTNGVIDLRNRHLHQVADIVSPWDAEMTTEDLEWYGFDPQAPTPDDDGLSTVNVDDTDALVMTDAELQEQHAIDCLRPSNRFGMDIFIEACNQMRTL